MTSRFRRDTMSSGNSSSFSMPQNQEKKQIPRYEVRFTNKNHPFMWLVCKTRAKILLSDPETSLTTSRLLPLRRSSCLRADVSYFFPRATKETSARRQAIETIIWKLSIAPVVWIVLKHFKTTGAIGTIRTIIWKPGFRSPQGAKELRLSASLVFYTTSRASVGECADHESRISFLRHGRRRLPSSIVPQPHLLYRAQNSLER